MTRKEKHAIRLRVYEEAGECCERCGIGLVFESGRWQSMHLSHKRSRGAGGDWSRENLECLCLNCHLVGVHSPKCVPRKSHPTA